MKKLASFLKNVKWKHYVNYIGVAVAMLAFALYTFLATPKASTLYLLENITMPIYLERNVYLSIFAILLPSYMMSPALGVASPERSESRVVLPAPDFPIIQYIFPFSKS